MREKYIQDGAVMHDPTHGATWSRKRTKPEVLHAETNAIAKVAQSPESCIGTCAICYTRTCLDCAKLIHQSGIQTCYIQKIHIKQTKDPAETF